MSTVSASSYDLSSSLKRKRGRPRKDETSGSDSNRRVFRSPHSNVNLVGREVSGSFVGVFDTGYLLTVQVGDSGPIMSGLVFDPRLAVPISAENDIAPHLPMLQRNHSSPPFEGDFLNRGALSPQAYAAPKTPMEMAASDSSRVLPSAGETVGPAKTFKIFLEGAAAETSKHLDSQVKVEDTPISAGLSNASNPTYPSNPSVVSPMPTSLEASKNEPADISKISDEPSNIPKEAPPGLPFKISPSAVFKALEPSAQNTNPDEQKSPAASRRDETVDTQNMDWKNLPSHEPYEDRKADDFLLSVVAESRTAVAEKLEDDPTVPEASTFQP